MLELNRIYNVDCMAAMRDMPDKYFELAICDPPYGIGHDGQRRSVTTNPKHSRKYHERKFWDKSPPPREYFAELERVSVNQIIWGGNHFAPMIGRGTRGWIIWDKGQRGLSMSDCELAYSSFNRGARIVTINRAQLQAEGETIHPTQKPVKLYKWILQNYANPGDKIIDTHAGSASSLIACHDMYFDFIGFEIDAEYYAAANGRLITAQSQIRFSDIETLTTGGG